MDFQDLKNTAANAAPAEHLTITSQIHIAHIAGDGWGQDTLPNKKPWCPFQTEDDDGTEAGQLYLTKDARILFRIGQGPDVFSVHMNDILTTVMDAITTHGNLRMYAECAARWIRRHPDDAPEIPIILNAADLIAGNRLYLALEQYGQNAVSELLAFGLLVAENRIGEHGEYISEEEDQAEIDPAEREDPPDDDLMPELVRQIIHEAETEATAGTGLSRTLDEANADAISRAQTLIPWLKENAADQTTMLHAAELIANGQFKLAYLNYGPEAITALLDLGAAIRTKPDIKL